MGFPPGNVYVETRLLTGSVTMSAVPVESKLMPRGYRPF
jgi:hypothetical protein